MKWRILLFTIFSLGIITGGPQLMAHEDDVFTAVETKEKWTLSKDEWRKRLTPGQFTILRDEGTEKPGTSKLNDEDREGVYVCAGCGLPLFNSSTKYDSKTGWPSFWDVIPGHVGTKKDWKTLYLRTEYHCARCGGHQGHVFDDGPKDKTGLRYCNNGLALKFIPGEQYKPS